MRIIRIGFLTRPTRLTAMTDIIHEYGHLMSDPAHTAVEFTFVLIDVMIINKFRDWLHGHKRKKSNDEGSY